MYAVINTTQKTLHATGLDKEALETDIAQLKAISNDEFVLYTPVGNATIETLELLYGLTVNLLKVGKVDPLFITLDITDLLGETKQITARQVVNDARFWLDSQHD